VALDQLVDLGGESVRASLQAAAVDDEVARDLLAARLVREPEPAGFGTLLAHAEAATASSAAKAKPRSRRTPGRSKPDDSVARARLQEARKILRATEMEEQQAQQHWAQTKSELEKAQAAVEKAQGKLDRLRGD